ncbi:hypothetical protein ACVXHA_24350 [Escherichia coli]
MKAHLAPFVPGHSVVQIEGMLTRQGAVSAAPFGSASSCQSAGCTSA